MIQIRKSSERGHLNHGWLDTYHSFSFGHYVDREHVGFRTLRVINEDFIAPSEGFGTHGHADMEIITYLVEGQVAHKDSMGSVTTLVPGDVQVMSAGSGITHSEFNPSDTATTHLLQIWIRPAVEGASPRYAERSFPAESKRGVLRAIASSDEIDGALPIGQDATVFASILPKGDRITHTPTPKRGVWIQLVRGALVVNGEQLQSGDGAAIDAPTTINIEAQDESEFLLFELA